MKFLVAELRGKKNIVFKKKLMETNSIKFKLVIWRYFNPFLFCTNGSFQLRDWFEGAKSV